jgi:hypothetical protein
LPRAKNPVKRLAKFKKPVLLRSAGAGNGAEWGLLQTHNHGTGCNDDLSVGVGLWALSHDLVAKRIDAGNRRLAAVEWKSGSNMSIIDIVAPFGGEAEMWERAG